MREEKIPLPIFPFLFARLLPFELVARKSYGFEQKGEEMRFIPSRYVLQYAKWVKV